MLAYHPPNLYCADVALAWDANTEPHLSGYKIHYGTASRSYTHTIDVGNTLEYVVTGLTPGKTYCFAATAYDSYQNQSDYSDEVVYLVPQTRLDSDGDGISDTDEMNIYQTDPYEADTDGDGVNDGEELNYWGGSWNEDSDGDGIINLLDYDSDGDGLSDGAEIGKGLNPSDSSDSGITVYEDAEDGTIERWTLVNVLPSSRASISNVFDSERGSSVIQFRGASIADGYLLSKTDGGKWRNPKQFVIEWSMQFSEAFLITIDMETSAGRRILTYLPFELAALGINMYVYRGLGTDARSGMWRTFARDLQSDLNEAQPGVAILEVNSFLIRGSGRVDDIRLRDYLP